MTNKNGAVEPSRSLAIIEVGAIYEDCAFHPVLCTYSSLEDDEVRGISLIDGGVRSCSILHCGPQPLTLDAVLEIKKDFGSYVEKRTADVQGHSGG